MLCVFPLLAPTTRLRLSSGVLSEKENIISAGRSANVRHRARHRRLRPGRVGDRAAAWRPTAAASSQPTSRLPPTSRRPRSCPSGVEFRWADLTDPEQVQRLVSDVAPAAIIHLAAIIAPAIYRMPKVARRVNVDATATLVRVAEAQPTPPRFVHASSNAVFGPRNPHRTPPPLTADDPMRPCDIYSGTKAEAEEIVRSSSLEWVVLRFGGVLSTDLSAMPLERRRHVLRERAAERRPGADRRRPRRRVGVCRGDDGRRRRRDPADRRRRVTPDAATATSRRRSSSALGIPGAIPPGRPGNPDSDTDWFVTDWMDTTRAQEALKFQHYSWPDMVAELSAKFGWTRYSGAAGRADRPRGDEAPVGVLECAGPVRRSVGRDPRQVGRPVVGSAERTALTA